MMERDGQFLADSDVGGGRTLVLGSTAFSDAVCYPHWKERSSDYWRDPVPRRPTSCFESQGSVSIIVWSALQQSLSCMLKAC